MIENNSDGVFVSAVSLWEVAIKVSLGKLKLPLPFDQIFPHQLDLNQIEVIPILPEHLSVLMTLPWHHRDPFDRLLVAQSIAERTTLVSLDERMGDYGVNIVW